MIRLSDWKQLNNSDKIGTIWASKNLNLDQRGYIKLSPRTILIAAEDIAPNQGSVGDVGVPAFIGRFDSGEYLVVTTDDIFNVRNGVTTKAINKTNAGNPPSSDVDANGVFFNSLFVASGSTIVSSRAISTDYTSSWTSRITGLSAQTRLGLAVFQSRTSLCVSQNNTITQYNTSWASLGDTLILTIPADFDIVGMAYNNQSLGVITRLGSSSQGQNTDAHFFVWDGTGTGAQRSAGVNSDACLAVCPYKGSFAVLTRAGQLLYWNGGGFDILANFPVWFDNKFLSAGSNNSSLKNHIVYGDIMVTEGDVIYINMPTLLESFGFKREQIIYNFPQGIWCYDPPVGLYHRWSPSRSAAYLHSISSANINTTTDVFTTSSTIPATGNPVKVTSLTGTVGGIVLNKIYFVIKVSSTTFKLATSKANADAGTAIDITSASGTTTIWMYDLVDYSTTVSVIPASGHAASIGALALVGENVNTHTEILIGGSYYDTGLTGQAGLCIAVPLLENRGWCITPKIFSSEITDNAQKLVVKFQPLKQDDKIIIKYRNRDIDGLPVASTGNPDLSDKSADWGNARSFTTTQDLSEALTYFTAGGELELELVAGAGAGQMEKIVDIHAEGSSYSVSVGNDVVGASSGKESEFIIHNWEVKRTIASTDSDIQDGFVEIPLGSRASWLQFKIELRGSETTIEELQVISAVDKQSI